MNGRMKLWRVTDDCLDDRSEVTEIFRGGFAGCGQADRGDRDVGRHRSASSILISSSGVTGASQGADASTAPSLHARV